MEVLIKTGLVNVSQSDFILPLLFNSKPKNELAVSTGESSDAEAAPNSAISDCLSTQLTTESEDASRIVLLEEQRLEEHVARIKKEAYKKGYDESILDVKLRYNEQFEKIDALIKVINDALPSYLKKNESVIASIVFESVCKIIGEELANKSKSISVVEQTIKAVDKDKIREVLISQENYNSIVSLNSDLSSDVVALENTINEFVFKVDPEIKYGGCKIKLIDGYMDASIDGQLKILAKSLRAKAEDLAG